VQEVRRRAPGRAPAPVVAGGGAHVGVPGELLHRGDVRAAVEEVAHVGAAQVVRGEVVHPGLGRALGEDGVDRLRGQPPPGQVAPLVDRANAFSPGAMVAAQRGPPLLGFACLTRRP